VLPRSLAIGILTLVSLVWSVDFGAQFVIDHQPSPAIQGTFLALVGGALIRAGWVARKEVDAAKPPEVPPEPEPPLAPAPPEPDPPRYSWERPHDPYETWREDDGRHRRPPYFRLLRRARA
jgi:hypothetical protein